MNYAFILLFTVTLLASGWAQNLPLPAETDFHSDRCLQCRMVVTSKNYAAQLVGGKQVLFFDDIGCLVQWERKNPPLTNTNLASSNRTRYVRSATGSGWLEVSQAYWVSSKDVRTPMGYGFHALSNPEAVDTFRNGKSSAISLPWEEVLTAVPSRMGMGMGMGKH